MSSRLYKLKHPPAKKVEPLMVAAHPGQHVRRYPDIHDVDYSNFYQEQIKKENHLVLERAGPPRPKKLRAPFATTKGADEEGVRKHHVHRSDEAIVRTKLASTWKRRKQNATMLPHLRDAGASQRLTDYLEGNSPSQAEPASPVLRAALDDYRTRRKKKELTRHARRKHKDTRHKATLHSPIKVKAQKSLVEPPWALDDPTARSKKGASGGGAGGRGGGGRRNRGRGKPARVLPQHSGGGGGGSGGGRDMSSSLPPALVQQLHDASKLMSKSLSQSLFPPSVHGEPVPRWKVQAKVGDADTETNLTYHRALGDEPGYKSFTNYLRVSIRNRSQPQA